MSALVCNPQRGDVTITIDGQQHRLRLTLGALAELEHAFAAPDLATLEAALRRAAASDMVVVLATLMRAGGGDGSQARNANPNQAALAIAEAFAASNP